MTTAEFPSAKAAWEFSEEARASGHKVRLWIPPGPRPNKRIFWSAVLFSLVLGSLFGVLGAYAEAGVVGLPPLEPLFAAPVGAVTALLSVFGGSLGALLGGLVALTPARRHAAAHYVTPNDWRIIVPSGVLSHMGKYAMLMLLNEDGSIPDSVRSYLSGPLKSTRTSIPASRCSTSPGFWVMGRVFRMRHAGVFGAARGPGVAGKHAPNRNSTGGVEVSLRGWS